MRRTVLPPWVWWGLLGLSLPLAVVLLLHAPLLRSWDDQKTLSPAGWSWPRTWVLQKRALPQGDLVVAGTGLWWVRLLNAPPGRVRRSEPASVSGQEGGVFVVETDGFRTRWKRLNPQNRLLGVYLQMENLTKGWVLEVWGPTTIGATLLARRCLPAEDRDGMPAGPGLSWDWLLGLFSLLPALLMLVLWLGSGWVPSSWKRNQVLVESRAPFRRWRRWRRQSGWAALGLDDDGVFKVAIFGRLVLSQKLRGADGGDWTWQGGVLEGEINGERWQIRPRSEPLVARLNERMGKHRS